MSMYSAFSICEREFQLQIKNHLNFFTNDFSFVCPIILITSTHCVQFTGTVKKHSMFLNSEFEKKLYQVKENLVSKKKKVVMHMKRQPLVFQPVVFSLQHGENASLVFLLMTLQVELSAGLRLYPDTQLQLYDGGQELHT